MNERIKKLWSQTVRNYGHSGQETCAQQFAELIVKECIDCINETDKGYVFTAQDAGIVGAAHNRSIKTIKEHFGVEDPPVDDVDRILRTVRTRVVKS
jgi:hypothetical protein